jgi:ABC-type uncharacterized transport system substrate-binding protein
MHSTVRRVLRIAGCLTLALIAVPCLFAAGPIPVMAQSPERVYRLGHLAQTAQAERLTREFTLVALAELGFVEGRNLNLIMRAGVTDTLPNLARELLATKPDVIIAIGTAATRVTREATDSVPIVMFADDPVGLGLATSFSRPDRNVTGVANMVVELQSKRLALLLEAVPMARRVAALLRRTSLTRERSVQALRAGAAMEGIELLVYTADGPSDYHAAFTAMRAAGSEALLIGSDPQFYGDRALLAALAREARLPTSCEWIDMARVGCLLGYGPNQAALRRRLAHYVARILRGALVGDLPIEQPTTFELAFNLETARGLGVTIPSALLARADELIE